MDNETKSRGSFIVLEGLDGVGKTTLGNTLSQMTGYAFFDSLPDIYRKTFSDFQKTLNADALYLHTLGMLKHLSGEIGFVRDAGQGVILARYYPTTTACYVARCQKAGRLPSMPMITNPDLLCLEKPSCMYFLNLPEEIRQKRLFSRGDLSVDDNASLDASFRETLLREYAKHKFEILCLNKETPEEAARLVLSKAGKTLFVPRI